MTKGTKDMKKEELQDKKQVLAGKMKGNNGRNAGNPEDNFSSKEKKKEKSAYKADNGKEPKSSWTT